MKYGNDVIGSRMTLALSPLAAVNNTQFVGAFAAAR